VKLEQDNSIIKEYDKKSLHPVLLKCYHHLHLVPNCEIVFTKQRVDENYTMYLFQMTPSTSELVKELITR
jgi:hypothetical protein